MTTTIRDINELQDRRIMMEKKLPPFGYALILLTAALILFLVVWSTKNYRTYVSQSSGSVQAANKTYIMSSYSGSITELNIAEGTYVNEGDLIAHIKSTDLDMQQDSIQSQLDIYKKQKSQYEKLVKSIQDDKNYFSETDIDDQPYYYQYETYKSQVEQKTFDASAYQAAGYTDAQIKTMMEQNQSEIQALYYSTMQSISQSITSAQSNVDNVQAQIDAFQARVRWAEHYVIGIHIRTGGMGHEGTRWGRFLNAKDVAVFKAYAAALTHSFENGAAQGMNLRRADPGERDRIEVKMKARMPVLWYVVSDQDAQKEEWRAEFGEMVQFTQCEMKHTNKGRQKKADPGFTCALLENYLLSLSDTLVLTTRSTYGYLARHRTNVPFVTVDLGDYQKWAKMTRAQKEVVPLSTWTVDDL